MLSKSKWDVPEARGTNMYENAGAVLVTAPVTGVGKNGLFKLTGNLEIGRLPPKRTSQKLYVFPLSGH